jgi:trans-aconitate 2-methyltransferase
LYLKFGKERIQPTIDLVSKIDFANPATIIDIGCGPGNSTQILLQRWPESKIVGIDNSEAMIQKAKQDYPAQEWKLMDADKELIPGRYDIVFSNATIQWIPGHFGLLQRLRNNLTENGLLAIQLPLFFEMPLGKSIAKISKEKRWAHLTEIVNDLFTIHSPSEYYNMLSEIFSSFEIWVTDYIHVMDSHHSVLEMIRSSGLRPYLDRLETKADKKDFEALVFEDIKNDYKAQPDGKVLFPFTRFFMIARK